MQPWYVIAGTDSFKIHTDFPFLNGNEHMLLDVFYSTDTSFSGSLQLQFYKFNSDGDSFLVLNKKNDKLLFKAGLNKTRLDLAKSDSNTYYVPEFYEILKRTNAIAPGSYSVLMTITKNGKKLQNIYLHQVDSNLTAGSPVRSD